MILSGGGAFYYDAVNDKWSLAGVMETIATFTNQPSDTAVYGNLTYYADISKYRTFILQTIPEPSSLALLAASLAVFARTLLRRRVP